MNRSKKLGVLLGILAAVCAAAFTVMRMEEQKEQIRETGEIILELPAESVEALSWECGETSLSFHRDETWLYDGDECFPVSEENISGLLETFRSFGAAFTIENPEDLGPYGLDDPVCTIRLSTADRTYEIQLGDYSKMDAQRYVSIGDGNVYLVKNDPLDLFDTTLNELIDHDEVPNWDRVTELRLEGEEICTAVYREGGSGSYSPDDVYFVRRNGRDVPLDSSRVENYLWLLRSIHFGSYVSYNASDEELARYGLDDPDLTAEVHYTARNEAGDEEDGVFVLRVSRDLETKQAAEQGDAGEEELSAAYMRAGNSTIIYEISGDRYEELTAATYDDLRHPEVIWADFSDIRQIDISLEGSSYTFTSEKDGKESVWSYRDKDELEMDDLRSSLEYLTANEFTDERPSQKEEIGLTIHLDNEHFPQVQIELYRYDGTRCLAAVDGESVSLVDRGAVVDLIEAVHAIVLD